MTMFRVRLCVPPPHVTVQLVNDVQGDSTQSTGHGCVWQECVSVSAGQALPPCAGTMEIERERVFVPLPHDLVHAVHELYAVTSQCTGQAPLLQDCVSVDAPQAAPPESGGVTIERERVCVPAAHVVEHALHAEKADCTQSTGHEWSLHDCTSAKLGQIEPECSACSVIERVRVCCPPPQDSVQVDHDEKALTSQSTGHEPR